MMNVLYTLGQHQLLLEYATNKANRQRGDGCQPEVNEIYK